MINQFVHNISSTFQSNEVLLDQAGLVDEVLTAVGFGIAALAVSSWIGLASMNKGADIASCIEGQNIGGSQNGDKYCNGTDTHVKDNSYTKSETYKNRFGRK